MTDIQVEMRDDWNERAATPQGAWKAIIDGYDGDKAAFYGSGKKHVEDMLQALVELDVNYSKWKRILEVGCGVGRLTVHLASIFDNVVATDISDKMIDYAPKLENIEYKATGTLALPEWRYSFDAVVSHLVFQHMPKREFWRYLDEIHDVLEPDGVFITQLHETEEPVEYDGHTILVRGYTKEELASFIDPEQWEVLGLLYPAGISEMWRWLVLRKK